MEPVWIMIIGVLMLWPLAGAITSPPVLEQIQELPHQRKSRRKRQRIVLLVSQGGTFKPH